jgi:hypothetical protein
MEAECAWGIISSTIQELLEHEFQKIDRPSAALVDYFDVVAGTSNVQD